MKVEQTIEVEGNLHDSFELFTTRIAEWWPLASGFAYSGDRAASIHLEARIGGRFFERLVDDDELQVGTVTECDPPRRIVFTWAAPDWPAPTEGEVRFEPTPNGTLVSLEHRLFERLGPEAQPARDGFAGGWPTVLAGFADSARGR